MGIKMKSETKYSSLKYFLLPVSLAIYGMDRILFTVIEEFTKSRYHMKSWMIF